MKKYILNWMKLSSFIFALSSLFASCSNELDEALQPVHNGTLQFVVSDFPAFGENPETRASQIGIPDAGKTAWEAGDEIIVELYSSKYKSQCATLIYDGSQWNLNGSLLYLENETPAVLAYYAPCYEVAEVGLRQFRDGMLRGMTEYLVPSDCQVENNSTISISFDGVTRDYSRLRIVGLAGQTYTVTTTGFTPAGATSEVTEPYTLTADDKGNAYLYGTFAEGATVTVKQGDFSFADYTFAEATEATYGYALDARPVVGGTLSGKPEATEDDITALVDEIKSFVDNGITTIVVTGSEPAMCESALGTIPAYAEALYLLTDQNEDSPYCGTIDLILQDATEIIDFSFDSADALKSITLPKVTTVGNGAFYGCLYLEKLTFGSVVTSIDDSGGAVFYRVGEKVDGGLCNLVLNSEQVNAEADYQPNIEARTWWNTEWKSITLQ